MDVFPCGKSIQYCKIRGIIWYKRAVQLSPKVEDGGGVRTHRVKGNKIFRKKLIAVGRGLVYTQH